MTHLTIGNKKYILVTEENYQQLKEMAVLKHEPEITFYIEEARNYSKSLIRKWASER